MLLLKAGSLSAITVVSDPGEPTGDAVHAGHIRSAGQPACRGRNPCRTLTILAHRKSVGLIATIAIRFCLYGLAALYLPRALTAQISRSFLENSMVTAQRVLTADEYRVRQWLTAAWAGLAAASTFPNQRNRHSR